MSRSIEVRLKQLETALAPPKTHRIRLVTAPTREKQDAEIARLKAEGFGPETLFVRLVGIKPDPDSAVPDRGDDIH
jgi:hypothetical protein